MRKLVLGTAAAIALMTSGAMAEEVTGVLEKIDLNDNSFTVGDKRFTASPSNTVGDKITDLMEGDKVKVVFQEPSGGSGSVINAQQLEKVEE